MSLLLLYESARNLFLLLTKFLLLIDGSGCNIFRIFAICSFHFWPSWSLAWFDSLHGLRAVAEYARYLSKSGPWWFVHRDIQTPQVLLLGYVSLGLDFTKFTPSVVDPPKSPTLDNEACRWRLALQPPEAAMEAGAKVSS
ncbi:hypothetical protein FF1_035163 [Malus domestica]